MTPSDRVDLSKPSHPSEIGPRRGRRFRKHGKSSTLDRILETLGFVFETFDFFYWWN